MDDRIYTSDVIDQYIISQVCQDDKTLYKYYTEGDIKKYRARLSRVTDQKTISKIALTLCTDTLRPIIYELIGIMSKNLSKYGNLIISGGEAFNLYFDKKDRIITGDIDTKYVPNINPNDPKFFGKIQVTRLAMWNAIGKAATHANRKCIFPYNKILKASKAATFLGIQISNDNPFRIRYTLLPKQKKGRKSLPREGNVFMDVGIFAIDLNVRYFNIDQKKVTSQKLGGILDAPIIRRDEFSSDVYKDFITTSKGKIASKRFLLEDVELLVKYGIRKGAKLKKDKQRLRQFIEFVLKAPIPPRATFDQLMKIAKKKLPKRPRTKRLTLKPFPINDWRKFNPWVHEKIISPASISQVIFLLYPLLDNIKALKRVPVDYRFDPGRARWVPIKNNKRLGNIYRFRPDKNGNLKINLAVVKKMRNEILEILKKEKIPMPALLYGFVPGRDDWMPTGLIDRAAAIGLLGQLK